MSAERFPAPPRPYAEFALGFVIARSTPGSAGARGRLDAVERTLGELVRRWHVGQPLSPARDLRMAESTIGELLDWVEHGTTDPSLLPRLGVYHSGAVADPAVPRGWVRVYVGAERGGPETLRAHRG